MQENRQLFFRKFFLNSLFAYAEVIFVCGGIISITSKRGIIFVTLAEISADADSE